MFVVDCLATHMAMAIFVSLSCVTKSTVLGDVPGKVISFWNY